MQLAFQSHLPLTFHLQDIIQAFPAFTRPVPCQDKRRWPPCGSRTVPRTSDMNAACLGSRGWVSQCITKAPLLPVSMGLWKYQPSTLLFTPSTLNTFSLPPGFFLLRLPGNSQFMLTPDFFLLFLYSAFCIQLTNSLYIVNSGSSGRFALIQSPLPPPGQVLVRTPCPCHPLPIKGSQAA